MRVKGTRFLSTRNIGKQSAPPNVCEPSQLSKIARHCSKKHKKWSSEQPRAFTEFVELLE